MIEYTDIKTADAVMTDVACILVSALRLVAGG